MSAFSYPPAESPAPPGARIEIIPLIDVVFFLLATFVLFTLSLDRRQAIELTLPAADKIDRSPPPLGSEPVLLQLSDAGRYYWDKELMSLPQIKVRLNEYAAKPDARIMLGSDDHANYGEMIKLLDAVRLSGIDQVSIETRYRATGT